MAGAVNVSVVSCLGFVFDMAGVDCDFTGFFFRCAVNVFVGQGFGPALLGEDLGDGLSPFVVIVIVIVIYYWME